jgi:ABC-type dipeptide/oligopeptide/nickel transport system ATPase component
VRIPEAVRRMNQFPHELSGGMRQRVMIAIAMLCNPEILIADEPTTALDVTVQAQVLELMDELKRETGTGIALITHNMGVVARMCDRVIVMRQGEIVEEGEHGRHLLRAESRLYEDAARMPCRALTSQTGQAVPALSEPPPCRHRAGADSGRRHEGPFPDPGERRSVRQAQAAEGGRRRIF